MGLNFVCSNSSYDNYRNDEQIPLPNPDPSNYIIRGFEYVGKCLIVEIQYLDCTNFEGRKVLLFENCTIEDLKKQGSIDPHFSNNNEFISPIARFIPTPFGYDCAIQMANYLYQLNKKV